MSELTNTGTFNIGAIGSSSPTGHIYSGYNTTPGQIYTNTTTGVTSVNTGNNWVPISPTGAGPTGTTGPNYITSNTSVPTDIYITSSNGETIQVAKTLRMLMDRLCIIEPTFEKIEKYAALKKAYENYKMIESLIQEEYKDGK